MRVNVLMFGPVRDLVGEESVSLDLSAGADVRALQGLLIERYPALRAGITAVRFSVNRQFADDDRVLADGDEVAIIPPVSGG